MALFATITLFTFGSLLLLVVVCSCVRWGSGSNRRQRLREEGP